MLKHSLDSDFDNSLLTWFSACWCYPACAGLFSTLLYLFLFCQRWEWAVVLGRTVCHLLQVSFCPVQRFHCLTQPGWFELYLTGWYILSCSSFPAAVNCSFKKPLSYVLSCIKEYRGRIVTHNFYSISFPNLTSCLKVGLLFKPLQSSYNLLVSDHFYSKCSWL